MLSDRWLEGCSVTIGSHDWEGLTLAGGRYRITAKLGEGGMGFVYRALDQNIDADVVIKVPRQAMMDDPEFAGRFTREIRSLVKLSHPHIVKVTDVGTCEGTPFAVMQYLPGGSLEDQRPAGPDGQVLPCDPRNVSRWLIAVAEALDYIHGQGYVHRDVKPGNILFDALGHAFLSDFGVAKVLASSDRTRAASQTAMTGAGMVLGTPEYMAPELIMGEPFDGRVDQYALAITVYEMLCGRRPFEDETKTKVLVLHTSKAPPPLTRVVPGSARATLAESCSRAWPKTRRPLSPLHRPRQSGRRRGRGRRCARRPRPVEMPRVRQDRLDARGRLRQAQSSPASPPLARHASRPSTFRARFTWPPESAPGGTMKFSVPGQFRRAQLCERASAPTGGGTTAFTAPGGSRRARSPQRRSRHAAARWRFRIGRPARTARSRENKPTPRHGIRDAHRTRPAAIRRGRGNRRFQEPGELPSPNALEPPQQRQPAADGRAAAKQTQLWIAVGAGASALLLVVALRRSLNSARGKKQSRRPRKRPPKPRSSATGKPAQAAPERSPRIPG